MTHTPHSLTVSLYYTKQPGYICRSYKNKEKEKKTAKRSGNIKFLDLVRFGIWGFAGREGTQVL